jgi:subtilisin family serine protease
MLLLKKPSFALRVSCAIGIAALSSLILPSTSRAETPKYVEGQALVRWHTVALAQSLSSPNEQKESNLFRQWAKNIIASKLEKTFKGATVKQVYPNVGWALVEFPKTVKIDKGVSMLRNAFGSGNAVPNGIARIASTPNDSEYSQQWWTSKIKAPFAWDASTGTSDVIVAVLDTGSKLNHPDLEPNLWKNSGEIPNDGIDNDGNGYVDDVYGINTVNLPQYSEYERGMAPNDTDGHGTHVAGIIGAVGNNGTGIAGVNWNVRIMTLRFIGDSGYGSESAILEGIEYILMMKKRGVNIRVSNHSWGTNTKSSAIESAFKKLNSAKILNVCAAGNGTTYYNGANNDAWPNYPSSFNNTSIIAVAATDENDNRATFSNYGAKSVDLAAPGVDILSLGITSPTTYMDGTSMATPIVSGAAALLLSTQPKLTVSSLRSKILKSVDAVPALKKVVATGGRLNLARLMGQSRVTISGETYFSEKIGKTKYKRLLAGTKVQAIFNKSKAVVATTYTDSNGQFSFVDLPVGAYTFTPTLSGYKFSNKKATLADKKTPSLLKLEGKPTASTYSISGRATDLNNNPVSGVNIFVNDSAEPAAVTDSSGDYVLNYRAEGTYTLRAESPNTEWQASASSVSLPTTTGASLPNATINFTVESSDNEAPLIAITSPVNGASFSTAPLTASGTASDSTNVAKLYFILEKRVNNDTTYYNWSTSNWTTDFSASGTIKEVAQSGKNVNWSLNLPVQAIADYSLMAWGEDTYGNETSIGSEALSNWSVTDASGSGSGTSASGWMSRFSIKRN